MKLKIISGIVMLSILTMLAGACSPTPGDETTPTTAPAATSTPTSEPASTPTPPSETSAPAATVPSAEGTLQVYVTDAPPSENVTSIMITLSEVQIHLADAEQEQEQEQGDSDNQTPEQEQEQEQEGEGEWITIELSDNTPFDLLLITGIEQYMGASNVTAGKCTQVRLVIENIQVALDGGELQDAEVPSNELKIAHPFSILAGETTAMTLDFDANKMVTVSGNGKITVKPVVKVITKQKGPKDTPDEDPDEEEDEDVGEEEETEGLEFEGTIEAIDGSVWTMTVDGETKTVDVGGAEIAGEPDVGLTAEVEGTVSGDTVIASKVEIAETEEEEEED